MTATPSQCPYCRAPYVQGSLSCAACKSIFPWAVEVESIRGELKARETNRIRATSTLVGEALNSARGGPPVSWDAIQGLISAWLFPRALIVIGSVAGFILIAFQTYILWGQTTILRLQVDAAQVEQAAKLRERIKEEVVLIERLTQIENGLGPTPSLSFDCAEDCESTRVLDKLSKLKETSNKAPSDAASLSLKPLGRPESASNPSTQFSVILMRVDASRAMSLNLRALRRLARAFGSPEMKKASKLPDTAGPFTALTEVIEPAFLRCFPRSDAANRVAPAAGLVRDLVTGIEAYENGVEPPVQMAIALGQLLHSPDFSSRVETIYTSAIHSYTVAQFSKDVTALHGSLKTGIQALRQECVAAMKRDFRAIQAIEKR